MELNFFSLLSISQLGVYFIVFYSITKLTNATDNWEMIFGLESYLLKKKN